MEGRSTLLLLVALCALAGTASANTYTVCWGPEDLLRALALAAASPQNQSIIELPRDIQLAPSHAAAYALPLRLDSRLVLRRAQDAGPVSLDLGGIRQLLLLQPGAELQLADLSVSGIATAEGRLEDLPTQARQLALFPTINAEPGALVELHNLSLALPASERCTEGAVVGGTQDSQPVIDAASNAAAGEVLVSTSNVSFSCQGAPTGSPAPNPSDSGTPSEIGSSSGGGNGSGTPAWVWAIVAIAVVAGVGGAAAGVFVWRQRAAAAKAPAVNRLEAGGGSKDVDKDIHSGTVSVAVFTPRG